MNVATVCFGFEPSNLRKQPWRYVHELVKALPEDGVELTVITDVERPDTAGIRTEPVNEVLGLAGPSREVVSAIDRIGPDVVVALVGQTSLLRPSTIASTIDRPTIGLFAGPAYSFFEIAGVGLEEFYRHHRYLAVPLAGSLVPDRWVRNRLSAFDHVVTLTDENQTRLRRAGVDTPMTTIPPGIDAFDLERPADHEVADVRDALDPEGVPLILYFTSPLTLRGTDTLVEAFARVRRSQPCKLVVLSRRDSGDLTRDERRLRRLARRRSVDESFELVSRHLSPDGMKRHLAAADVVALPFKIVLASVPISLLEAMAMGTPVVSTKVTGIPELVADERQLVEPGDAVALAETLGAFVSDPGLRAGIGSRNRERMERHPRWDEARTQFEAILEEHA